jgi:hypothetical protein
LISDTISHPIHGIRGVEKMGVLDSDTGEDLAEEVRKYHLPISRTEKTTTPLKPASPACKKIFGHRLANNRPDRDNRKLARHEVSGTPPTNFRPERTTEHSCHPSCLQHESILPITTSHCVAGYFPFVAPRLAKISERREARHLCRFPVAQNRTFRRSDIFSMPLLTGLEDSPLATGITSCQRLVRTSLLS